MRPVIVPSVPPNPEAAEAEQRRLRVLLIFRPPTAGIVRRGGLVAETVGGRCRAAVVVRDPQAGVEAKVAEAGTAWPYRAGLFAFAVAPAVVKALAGIAGRPDVLFCLGHGVAHPRRLGLAAHLGVLYDLPTLGCAERLLCGEFAPVPDRRGAWTPVRDQGEVVGAAVRTRVGVRPLFVSPGHRMDVNTAVRLVLEDATHYRWPDSLRAARELLRQTWKR